MTQQFEVPVEPGGWEVFIPAQVVLTGPVDRVETLVKDPDLGLELEIVRSENGEPSSFDLADTMPILSACEDLGELLDTMLPGEGDCLDQPWVMQLYKIVDGTPVPEAVGRLRNLGRERCVHIDANLLIGYPYTVAGSPYTVAGSPYTVAGSPYTVAGSGLSKLGAPATASDFWSQWALEQIGLVSGPKPTKGYTGQRVRVGVFDTSPFNWGDSGHSAGITATNGTQAEAVIDWVSPAMGLTVEHPAVYDLYPLPAPEAPAGMAVEPLPDLSDHGLSAAGLVHAVAEGCDIHLYRVLDQYARGNLFVLVSALLDFTSSTVAAKGETKGGVISLSLGIPQSHALGELNLPLDVLALNLALALAYCQGMVVVAASGNGSNLKNIAEPEIPASLPFVIGVAASNYDRQRACFSNKGDIAAPGGDGYRAPAGCWGGLFGKQDQTGCEVPWDRCGGDCWKYGLLGPILKDRDEKSDYARWAGTSFATPLVSGLAARILDKAGGWAHPAAVRAAFEVLPTGTVDPNLGQGIIDVAATLSP